MSAPRLPSDPEMFDCRRAMTGRRLMGLWRLLAGYRLLYLLAMVLVALSTLSKTATYLLLRFFVDEVLGQRAFGRVWWVVVGFIGLALVQGSFTFLSGRATARTAEGIARRLRDYLFDHIQRLPFAYHSRAQTGELIQRVTSDLDAVRRFYADQAVGMGQVLLLFGINFAAVARLNLRLALISIAVVPLTVLLSLFFFRRVWRAYEAYQEQEAKVSTVLQENLTGVRVVKAFARQAFERDKFERENGERFLRGRRLVSMHALYWPASDILCGAQMAVGYLVAALMVIDGTITVGTYLAYAGLVVWLIWPIRNLGRMIVQMSTGLVSYDRLAELVREEREPLEEGNPALGQRPVQGALEFRAVGFAYGDEREREAPDGAPEGAEEVQALRDITFRCEPGQVVALLGSTGSGKTTLVNLLPRFYDYTSGSLTLDGVELKEYPRHYLRAQIGIVEQEPFLFSRSIRENIRYGAMQEVSQEELEAAARAAAIHDVILTFPDGYDTLVGERGVTLSGGQKQRVAIARTLLRDPRILILDDSTSSVDTETESQIREALKQLMRGRTTFIIAHRIQSVMDADLILVLDRGRIVQQGRHEQLLAQDGMYRRIYEVQMQVEEECAQPGSDEGVEAKAPREPYAEAVARVAREESLHAV